VKCDLLHRRFSIFLGSLKRGFNNLVTDNSCLNGQRHNVIVVFELLLLFRDIPMDTDLSSISDDHRLDALSSLLGCVSITDVYVPAQDDVWLSSVVDWLLSLRTRLVNELNLFSPPDNCL